MKILLVEPFFSGAHSAWAQNLKKFCRFAIEILSLKGQHWKWRMHGGAVTLGLQFLQLKQNFDLIVVSDMLDLTTFQAVTRKMTANTPFVIYFHENQITYPWSPRDSDFHLKRDVHYGFINFSSALVADLVLFNSFFHCHSFLDGCRKMLKKFPDYQLLDQIEVLEKKSKVLPLGVDLKKFDQFKVTTQASVPTILWNNRWEYDKNPVSFFQALFRLIDEGIDFKLVVLGEQFSKTPSIFIKAKKVCEKNILRWGYANDFADYAKWLWRSDILLNTSKQDFFGISVVEAIYCGCYPLLPNRLAYTEHLEKKSYPDNFYDDEEELYSKLKKAVINRVYQTVDISSVVKKYDWEQQIEGYNSLLLDLAGANIW